MDLEAISNPLEAIAEFRAQAQKAGVVLPEAMTLATVSPDGHPRARVVLQKGLEGRQIYFFTNYESEKARDLAARPEAELCIHYAALELQARVFGAVSKLSPAKSDEYFATRPRESQIGAWASLQSKVLDSRATLDERVRLFEEKFSGSTVPRPEYWGGYRLEACSVELWRGQKGRLHERARFVFRSDVWTRELLYP